MCNCVPPPGSVGSNGLLEGNSSVVSTEHPPSIPPHIPTSPPPSTSSSLPPPYANVFLSDEGQVSLFPLLLIFTFALYAFYH